MKKIYWLMLERSFEQFEEISNSINKDLEVYEDARLELDEYLANLKFVTNRDIIKDMNLYKDIFSNQEFYMFIFNYMKYRGLKNMSV